MGERWSPVEQTLARLVAWDTVSHRPLTQMAGWLANRAEAAGMRVERFETSPGKVNVVATAVPMASRFLVTWTSFRSMDKPGPQTPSSSRSTKTACLGAGPAT